jgi:hypothetical protein
MHISDVNEKRWLQTKLESTRTNPDYPADFKVRLLERLTAAEGLEQYLHARYAGQKRFSLEGGETTITALDEIIQRGGTHGRGGDRDRHGPPRPPQRAGQHHGQVAPSCSPSSRASTSGRATTPAT